MIKHVVVAAAALAVGATAVIAQGNVLEERTKVMQAMGQSYYRDLSRMAKGEDPYDQAKVNAALARALEALPKVNSVFPDSTKGQASPSKNFTTSSKLWDNKADVSARVQKITAEVQASQQKIKSADDLKAALPGLLQSCQGCHDAYRLRKG